MRTTVSKSSILFRSDDMNGATAEILLKTGTKIKLDKIVECNRGTIDELLENFINSGEYRKFNNIFIIGTGFSKENADLIDKLVYEEGIKVIYRDHHKESLNLSKYMWGRILIWDRNGHEISSCKNLFREFIERENPKYIRLSILIDLVNACITDYKPEDDLEGAKTMETLYNLAGNASNFAKDMIQKIQSNDAFFNEADILAVIEAERKEREEREAKLQEMRNQRKNLKRRGI